MALMPAGFHKIRRPGGRVWILRDGFPETITAAQWDAWLEGRGGCVLTVEGGRRPTRVVPVEGIGEVVVRRYFHAGFFAPLTRDLFWDSRRPVRELAASEQVRRRGVATPEILAIYLRRVVGTLHRGCVLSKRIREGENLCEWLARSGLDSRVQGPVLRRAAQAIGALHEAGCSHRDLNLSNLLLSPGGVAILDLDGAKMKSELRVGERGSNLLRLYRSLRKETGRCDPLTGFDRLLFLKHYAAGNRRLYRDLATWLSRRWALHQMLRGIPGR